MNQFGETIVIAYGATPTLFTMPSAAKGGRDESFVEVSKSWVNVDNDLKKAVKGYRLLAKYQIPTLTTSERDSFIAIINDTVGLALRFTDTFYSGGSPTAFDAVVKDYHWDKRGGLIGYDAITITFEGVDLLSSLPTPP